MHYLERGSPFSVCVFSLPWCLSRRRVQTVFVGEEFSILGQNGNRLELWRLRCSCVYAHISCLFFVYREVFVVLGTHGVIGIVGLSMMIFVGCSFDYGIPPLHELCRVFCRFVYPPFPLLTTSGIMLPLLKKKENEEKLSFGHIFLVKNVLPHVMGRRVRKKSYKVLVVRPREPRWNNLGNFFFRHKPRTKFH